MKGNILKKIFVIAVAAAVLIPGANAIAGKGMGYGYHHGGGYGANLSEEQVEGISALKEEFYRETTDIRQAIQEKSIELRLVLTKENADVKKAKAIQKEISALQGKFAEKRIDFMIKLKKIAPEYGKGHMGGKGHSGGGFHGGGYHGGCGNW